MQKFLGERKLCGMKLFTLFVVMLMFPITPPATAQTQQEMTFNEVREFIGIDAWHRAGFSAQAVKIGIIDFGFLGLDNLGGNYQFPEATNLERIYGAPSNHGTLVYLTLLNIAPDAEFYLFQLDPGGRNFAEAVDWMLAQDVAVVNHSGVGAEVPLDGTNYLAAQMGRLVDADILVTTGAGNHGLGFVTDVYRDRDGDGWHDFETGSYLLQATPMFTQLFGESHLRWQDSYTSASIDLDLYIFDAATNLLDAATGVQQGGSADWPYEDAFYAVQAGVPFYIAVRAKSSAIVPDEVRFYIYADNAILNIGQQENSIAAPGDHPRVVSVGGIESNGNIWARSGRGPTWDGRIKPDLVAPMRVFTGDELGLFVGTSASAPIVAGAAAVIRGAFPNLSEAEVRTWLRENAKDLGPQGADNSFGYGRIWLPPPN